MIELLILFFEFFKIGLFTFGGGYAMIPLIQEVVLSYGWLSENEFYDFIGVCESTPGPVAINMATYIGFTQQGVLGSAFAVLGVVLPSFIIILLIAIVLKNVTKNKHFKNFLKGVNPVVVALLLSTGFILLIKSFGYVDVNTFNANPNSMFIFMILCGIYFAHGYLFKRKMSAVMLIIFSALIGILINVI